MVDREYEPQRQENVKFGKEGYFYVDEAEERENNALVGKAGEEAVLAYERARVPEKYASKITHDSVEKGDGLGYDILSFDSDGKGQNKYIEVKTTMGGCSTPFFLTRHELEKSRIEKSNYYLYRVFNFDIKANTGKLKIIRGALDRYCVNPIKYKIILKRK